jgi:hypothetical protein
MGRAQRELSVTKGETITLIILINGVPDDATSRAWAKSAGA